MLFLVFPVGVLLSTARRSCLQDKVHGLQSSRYSLPKYTQPSLVSFRSKKMWIRVLKIKAKIEYPKFNKLLIY